MFRAFGLLDLGFSVVLREDVAGTRADASIGGETVRIYMPPMGSGPRGTDIVTPPPSLLPRKSVVYRELHEDDGGWLDWGYVVARTAGSIDAWQTTRVLVGLPRASPEDFEYSNYLHGRGRPQGDLRDRLFASVDDWRRRLAEWIEVLSDQDAERRSPLRDLRHEGAGFTLATREDDMHSLPERSNTTIVVVRHPDPIDLKRWRRIVRLASRGSEPPTEHLLLADARAFQRRGDHRRAVLDAGAAAELSLRRLVDQQLARLGEGGIAERLTAGKDRWTLGRLVQYAGPLTVVGDLQRDLVEPRNRAAHHSSPVSHDDAQGALTTADSLVELVEPRARLQ